MASARRRPRTSLKDALFSEPQAYDFFQAVRLLELIGAQENRQAGQAAPEPVGRGVEPARAALMIRSAVPLGFAAAEVTSTRRPRSGGPIELTQTIVGLTGPSGVLPHALSELVQVSVRERNPALRDFFDLFNNRLAGLLYDAWAKYRLAAEHERASAVGTPRNIDTALKATVGLALASTANRTETPDSTLVFFGGMLGRESRSAMAVERTLSGALGHPVRVRQFLGEWLVIGASDQTRLPDRAASEGAFARLGHDAVIGQRSFDIESSVLLCVGPLRYRDFRSLLPDGARAHMLTDIAAIALGADKSFRICLLLMPQEVPDFRLQGDSDDPGASRLGWNTWLPATSRRLDVLAAEFQPPSHLR